LYRTDEDSESSTITKNAEVPRDNSQLEERRRNLEEENQSMEGGNRGALTTLTLEEQN